MSHDAMLFELHGKKFMLDKLTLESYELTEQQYLDIESAQTPVAPKHALFGQLESRFAPWDVSSINQAKVYEANYAAGRLQSFVIYLTTSCNLRCKYCWNQHGTVYGHGETSMTEEQARRVLDFILSKEPEQLKVTFMGGEPFLAFHPMEYFVQTLRAKYGHRVRFLVNTNGTILSRKWVAFLIDNNVETFFSIDGPPAYHDRYRVFANGKPTFEKVIENLRMARDMGLKLNVGATITREAIADLEDVLTFFLDQLPSATIAINPVRPAIKTRDGHAPGDHELSLEEHKAYVDKYLEFMLDRFYTKGIDPPIHDDHISGLLHALYNLIPREWFCPIFAGTSVTITPNGNIYPCHQFVTESHCIGDISQGFRAPEKVFFAEPLTFEPCQDCNIHMVCGGGACLGKNYVHNHDIKALYVPFCEQMKYDVQSTIYALSMIPDSFRARLFASRQ